MTRKGKRPWADVFVERRRRRNLRVLARFFAFLAGIVVVYAVLFQVIMSQVEGQQYSWIGAVYWTLSTMTTLGVGDIAFTSDVGRLFTSFVLMSGIILLLVVLPFAFVRFFYAPWLEARRVPERIRDHVIIANWGNIAPPLVDKLELAGIPYYVIESDPARAGRLQEDGVSVVTGEADDRATYDRLRAESASMVLCNAEDTTNTNITLTVREAAPAVPIVALADNEASIDILELAGATRVLPLQQRLGEQLANRLNAGHAQTHIIGSFRDMLIAEFPVHNTPFVGKSIREMQLREDLGLNVIGVLEQAQFVPARPDTRLNEHSVPVLVGSRKEIDALDEILAIYDANLSPVIVIGGGKVGRAAARRLKRKGVPVHMIEVNDALRGVIGDIPDRLFVGNAAERHVLMEAGLEGAPGVLLTTNDDAVNIYLTVYCRRLAPDIRIVSRITHDRNMEAIRRAGGDLALSLTSLGVQFVVALLRRRELVFLGEGVELFELPLPRSIAGRTLEGSEIAARTGLNVIAIQRDSQLLANLSAATRLEADSTLLMIGSPNQLLTFRKIYA